MGRVGNFYDELIVTAHVHAGADVVAEVNKFLDLAVEEAIVKKSGAWYTYDGEQLGQGRENAKKYLTENPEVMVEISDRVWKAVMPDEEEATVVTDVDEDEEFSDADDMPIALDD